MQKNVHKGTNNNACTRHVTTMTLADAEHYTDAEREQIIQSYPAHERDARAFGIPTLGTGRIFPIEQTAITIPAFSVPSYWPVIGGMDFGWDHPFAAVKLAWDRDSDVIYVVNAYKAREQTPLIHAAAVKPWGENLKWAWPHDGLQHDKASGTTLADHYRRQGMRLLPSHATFADGGNGVEAGIMIVLEKMQMGGFKVFNHLDEWLQEFRLYHRKDGKIVKLNDDLMAATRYAVMMLRYAIPPNQNQKNHRPPTTDNQYNPFQ